MTTVNRPSIQRGQIWDVKFDPQVGAEISKVRPAVVMDIAAVGRLPLHIVVPITTGNSKSGKLIWMLPVTANPRTGLTHDSFADAFQVKSVSEDRFFNKRGMLEPQELRELATLIAYCVGYNAPKLPPPRP